MSVFIYPYSSPHYTMARRLRKGMEDEDKLVDSDELSQSSSGIQVTVTDVENSTTDLQPRVEEEQHAVPLPITFKQRIKKLKSPRSKRLYWWVTVAVLGILAFLAVSIPLGLWSNLPKKECLDFEDVPEEDYEEFPYLYFPESKELDLCHKGETRLEGTLGINHKLVRTEKVDLYDYSYDTVLRLSRPDDDNFNCLLIEWTGTSSLDAPLMDCYTIEGSFWYGGYETANQTWDKDWEMKMTPFLPNDYLAANSDSQLGPIVHPLWVSSNATGILVDEGIPLHVSVNNGGDGKICIQALPYDVECIGRQASVQTLLKYRICVYETITDVAQHFLTNHIKHPNIAHMPDRKIFEDPIWSTWVEYNTNINISTLNDYYNDIIGNGFNISQLEIDDGYSDHYGDLSFDEAKFPVDKVKELSAKVDLTAWVHPFVNRDADDFTELFMNDNFLPSGGNSVSLVQWWNGYGSVFDFLNPNVTEQHGSDLENFRSTYGLTSFKFDGGEVTYLPECVHSNGLTHPAMFASAYAQFVSSRSYASRAEVRVGYFTQDLPILVRILDRDSTWSGNGLRSIIPTVLSLGIAGYPFVLPDMIGGNGDAADIKSQKELYIRWVQLNAFLPVMQFSVPPWSFPSDAVDHIRDMVKLHRDMSQLMLSDRTLDEVTNKGYPIIRPLWWMSDSEPPELWEHTNDQFLIGNEDRLFLVAPVLNEGGTVTRSVYFPTPCQWQAVQPNQYANNMYPGGQTRDFDVPLYETLYFEKYSC